MVNDAVVHDNEGLEDSGPFVGDRTDFASLQVRSAPWLRASGRVPPRAHSQLFSCHTNVARLNHR
jgi:hypothetical protein